MGWRVYPTIAALLIVGSAIWVNRESDIPGGARVARIYFPGVYRLAGDIGGLDITANYVTVDLAGHTIDCDENKIGIDAENRSKIYVRNGTITDCQIGMSAPYGDGFIVENMKFVSNHYISLYLGFGRNHLVKNSLFSGVSGDGVYAVGLNGVGSASLIEHNTFENINPEKGEGVAIIVSSGETGAVIRNNIIKSKIGNNIAAWVAEKASASFYANSISGYKRKIIGGGSIYRENVQAAGN